MQEPDSKCYAYALKYISRFPKTEYELKIKLLEKHFGEKEIDYTINYLKFRKFLDDAKFVEMYIHSELIRKGKPIYAVEQKLIHKGVDKSLIKDLIKENQDQIQSGIYNRIKLEIKKYKRKGIDGFDIIQKIMRKGYKLDDIKTVIQQKNKS